MVGSLFLQKKILKKLKPPKICIIFGGIMSIAEIWKVPNNPRYPPPKCMPWLVKKIDCQSFRHEHWFMPLVFESRTNFHSSKFLAGWQRRKHYKIWIFWIQRYYQHTLGGWVVSRMHNYCKNHLSILIEMKCFYTWVQNILFNKLIENVFRENMNLSQESIVCNYMKKNLFFI